MSSDHRKLDLGADDTVRPDDDDHDRWVGRGGTKAADRFHSYYFYDDDLRLAVDVALATRRSLLLEGPSGSGKSMMAEAVARNLGWRYYREVITSRTQAEDLLWTVDYVRRIGDAQAGSADLDIGRYIKPGVLWWAFDRQSAATIAGRRSQTLRDPSQFDQPDAPAVVLLDEIDKADADMPNDLLVPLGSMVFQVDLLDDDRSTEGDGGIDLRHEYRRGDGFVSATSGGEPLVIITSNQERELSEAFLRRCVRHRITLPDRSTYQRIALEQVPDASKKTVAELATSLVGESEGEPKVSIATFVDAVRATRELGIDLSDDEGQRLLAVFRRWQHRPVGAGPSR